MRSWTLYDPSTGEIVGNGVAEERPRHPLGAHVHAAIERDPEGEAPTHETHRVIFDEVFGVPCIVSKSEADRQIAMLPRLMIDVQTVIASELAASDRTQVGDFPIHSTEKVRWQEYRQALRDLSKKYPDDQIAMILAWPTRPDGADPIAALRARL